MPTLIGHWRNELAAVGCSYQTAPIWRLSFGELVAEVALATADEVGEAVAAATAAFPA